MRRLSPFFLALFTACGAAERSMDDAGAALDAGSTPPDAGVIGNDAGNPDDAGARLDAGESLDAGSTIDAGAPVDAGVLDAGHPFDAGAPYDAGALLSDGGYPPLTSAELSALSARPYRVVVPTSYDGGAEVPMVLLLHGYTDSGQGVDDYFHMTPFAQARGFILATPNGSQDVTFQRFWNATDGCCNLYGSTVDDVAYLTAILDDVRLRYRIDPKRVFVFGHSNGGFMSHRMACDRSSRIAGIASLSGANWKDVATHCHPSEPLAILEVHGTSDTTIVYTGGQNIGLSAYPSAPETLAGWAGKWGCTGTMDGGANLDIDATLSGAETTRTAASGCPNGSAELWTVTGAPHLPTFSSSWPAAAYDFLMAHPKP